jgi:hypothetical protein
VLAGRHLGEGEVEYFHDAVASDLDVRRLEIVVHNPSFVRGFEGLRNLRVMAASIGVPLSLKRFGPPESRKQVPPLPVQGFCESRSNARVRVECAYIRGVGLRPWKKGGLPAGHAALPNGLPIPGAASVAKRAQEFQP